MSRTELHLINGRNIKFSFSYAQNLDKFHYKKFMVSLFRRLKEYPYIANHDIDIPRSNQILIMTYGFTFKISIRLGYYTCMSYISISHFYFLVAPFSIPFLAMWHWNFVRKWLMQSADATSRRKAPPFPSRRCNTIMSCGCIVTLIKFHTENYLTVTWK